MKPQAPHFGAGLLLTILLAPVAYASASHKPVRKPDLHSAKSLSTHRKMTEVTTGKAKIKLKEQWNKTFNTAAILYHEMGLEETGLKEEAFEYAYLGYQRLLKKHLLHKTSVLSICDFSQASSQQRLYVIDVLNRKLIYRTFVAHGIKSGEEYASSFSNKPESNKSSLGFYITRQTYHGNNGLSLRIQGLDRGFNDRADKRNIVIHGAPYVSNRILKKYGVMGTTFGCPAIPDELSTTIIPVIKNGTCFFIYYPSAQYLAHSTVLNR